MAMEVDESKKGRSASTSTSGSAPLVINPIREPTAFAPPNPASTSSSGGPIFYNTNKKTPIHAAVSAGGTSVFSIEGYVNTPELSAGHGGGLSQGLLANGPYKSLFRARSESRGSNKPPAATAAAAAAPDAALHVLAEAAQSPEALSPVPRSSPPVPAPAQAQAQAQAQTSVPAPSHTPKKRRKPSPLATSSPVSSAAPLDSISAVRPSSAASTHASSSRVVEPSLSQLPAQAKPRGGSVTIRKANYKHKETVPQVAAQPDRNAIDGLWYERRHSLPQHQQAGAAFTAAGHSETGPAAQARHRNTQKSRAGLKDEVSGIPPPPAPTHGGNYDHTRDYYPYYEGERSDETNTVTHTHQDPPPPKISHSPGPSPLVVNQYPASGRITSKSSSPALRADSRSLSPGIKPRMITLLIEDRRYGADELAEVHVPLKTAGEGYLWADAKDICAALQTGPSRIDGRGFCVSQ